jgi:hypothetical protein
MTALIGIEFRWAQSLPRTGLLARNNLRLARHRFTTRHEGEPHLRDVVDAAGEAATIKSWH